MPQELCFATCQFGEDNLLHDRREQADVAVAFLQRAVLLKAVKQQRLKPEHVLKVGALRLERSITRLLLRFGSAQR